MVTKNVEKVIRYYLLFLPPRDVKSILDIGGGMTTPYKGVLRNRCWRYANIDKREGRNVDYVSDIVSGTPFKDEEWEWGWCVETVEHITKNKQNKFVKEVLRICRNVVFTFPTPEHPTFDKDPEHKKVVVGFKKLKKTHQVTDKSTKTGRRIFIVTKDKVEVKPHGVFYVDKKTEKPIDRWLVEKRNQM